MKQIGVGGGPETIKEDSLVTLNMQFHAVESSRKVLQGFVEPLWMHAFAHGASMERVETHFLHRGCYEDSRCDETFIHVWSPCGLENRTKV